MKQKLMLLLFTAIITQAFFSKANAQYDKIYTEYEGMRKVTKNNKAGFINSAGTLVIPIEYDGANNFIEGVCAVQMNGKIGFIDKTNKLVIPFIFEGVSAGFRQGNCIVHGGKKSWMIDKTGRQSTARKYDKITFDGRFGMVWVDKKFGYLNLFGKEVIPPKYDYLQNIREGLAGAKINGKFGFIDTLNQTKLPFIYDDVNPFSSGTSIVSRDKKFGLIDKKGNAIIPFQYEYLSSDSATGWLLAQKKDKMGAIDKKGNQMIPFNFGWIDGFDKVSIGYSRFSMFDKYDEDVKKVGVINKKGNIVIPANYDLIKNASKDGYCVVVRKEVDEKYGMIEFSTGKLIIDTKYDGILYPSEGICIAKKLFYDNSMGYYDDRWGYVNLNGKEITEIKYWSGTKKFSNGMAAVKMDYKWGFIDKTGKEVIKLQYDYASDFEDGKAMVELDGEEFYIDKKGKKVK